MARLAFLRIRILLSLGFALCFSTAMGWDLFGLKGTTGAAADPKKPTTPALPPAQQPIERIPGFSTPTYTGHFDAQGQHVITQIDRNSDTVKQWLKDGVISEDQIKKIETGHPTPVELPNAH